MRSNRTLAFLSLAAALVGAPLSLGCGALGERASTHECPEGETCSPATPSGLVFDGSGVGGTFLDTSLHATAVGGTQRVSFHARGGETLPASFAATVDPSIVEATGADIRSVTLRGISDGSTRLRVVDAADGLLLDRLNVAARDIAEVRLDALDLVVALAPEQTPVLTMASGATLFVHLVAAGGALLVDDGMALGAGTSAYTVSGRDGIEITEPVEVFGLDVEAGGRTFRAETATVSSIDDLELADWLLGEDATGATLVDAGGLFCVVARLGDARVIGGPGATFTVDGLALPIEEGQMTNCTTLPAHLGATATVTATLLGVARTFTLPVGDRDAAETMSLVSSTPFRILDLPRARARTLGDRAFLPAL